MGQKTAVPRGRGRPSNFDDRKGMIVSAAAALINRKGVRGMTMSEVAAALDLAPSAAGYYFRRKEDLAAVCYLQSIAEYERILEDALKARAGPATLRRLFQNFAELQRSIRVGNVRDIANFNDVRAIQNSAVDQAYIAFFKRVRELFLDSHPGGGNRQGRNARTHLLISQLYWAEGWLKTYDPDDYGRMLDRAADILIEGLAPKVVPHSANGLVEQAAGVIGRNSREAILCAATALINERGYRGVSVDQISARLNVSKGSFYHYIQVKDDLIGPCFDRTLHLLRQTQVEADKLASNGADALARMMSSLVSVNVAGDAPLLRLSALPSLPENLQADFVRRYGQVTARCASVVCDGIADGSLRPVDANVAAQMVIATINASTELQAWAPDITPDRAFNLFVKPLLGGIFGR
jgi:AcrR family transcriptional regulator